MRRRPWVLVIALLIFSITFSFIVGIRYLNKSYRLKYEIKSAMSTVPGDFQLEKASLDATTLNLSGITFVSEDRNIKVDVKKASVRFSIANWFKHKGGYERLIQSIIIYEPVVTINTKVLNAEKEKPENENIIPDLSRLQFLERIVCTGGKVNLESFNEDKWLDISALEGWVERIDPSKVIYEVEFQLFADSLNKVKLNGKLNTSESTLENEIVIENYDLQQLDLPENSPVYFEKGEFTLNGSMKVQEDTLIYSGDWSFKETNIQLKSGPYLSEIDVTGSLVDSVAVSEGNLKFEGDPTNLHSSYNLNSQYLSAFADIPVGRLGKHLEKFAGLSEYYQPKGEVEAHFEYERWGDTGRWEMNAISTAPVLGSPIGDFEDVTLLLSWDHEDNALSFDKITATYYGMKLDGTGSYRPRRDNRFPIDFDLKGWVDRKDLPEWTEPLKDKYVNSKVEIRYTPDTRWVVKGEGRARDRQQSGVGEFLAVYSRAGYDLRIDLFSPKYQDASARMWSYGNEPVKVNLVEPQILSGWWDEEYSVPERVSKLNTTLQFGKLNGGYSGSATIVDKSSQLGFRFDGTIKKDDGGNIRCLAGFTSNKDEKLIGNGDFSVKYSDKQLEISQFNFMDYLHANGTINFDENTFESLLVQINELEIQDFTSALTSLPEDKVSGKISGRIEINDKFTSPNVDSHFELFDGRYGNLEQYWGLLTFETDDSGEVRIQQGALGRAETTLLTIIGSYNIPDDAFNISLESPGTDADVFMNALTGRENLLQGTMSFSSHLTGSFILPQWVAGIQMQNAKVVGVEFESIDLSLRGNTSKRLGHVLYIDEFNLINPEHYRLQILGAIPFNRGAGQVSIVLDGNVLELLPQVTSLVDQAGGAGSVNWIITFVAGKPAATNGSVLLERGSITLSEVFPEIRNINMDVEIDNEGITDIRRLDAEISADHPVVIRNEIGDGIKGNREAIELENLGLNFGVIKFLTPSEDGIPMNFPGVSTTRDYTDLKFKGLGEEEWFYISGPLDSMLVEGKVSISRATITYPPRNNTISNVSGTKINSSVIDILKNIRWNAELSIEQSVNYEYEMRGIDNAPGVSQFSDIFSQIAADISIGDIFGQITADVIIEPTEPDRPIKIVGKLSDDSFRLNGDIVSNQGTIEFLDMTFEMEKAEVVFDETTILPTISGRAVTDVEDPTTGFNKPMYLTLYVIDRETGEKKPQGRWGEFTFVLEDELGSSQEEVLGSLGYEIGSLQEKVTTISVGGFEKAITRRWLRPIERDVARLLGLDLLKINPAFTQNLIGQQAPTDLEDEEKQTGGNLFRESKVTVGKYVGRDLFVSYTGQYGTDSKLTQLDAVDAEELGWLQTWSLEYRMRQVSPNFVLQGDWEYNNVREKSNRSFKLKYTFVYDVSEINWNRLWNNIRQ